MMYHTIKHGIFADEFARVLRLAMNKNDHILVAVPGNIDTLTAPIAKLLGAAVAKRLLEEREVKVATPGAPEKTLYLASINGCTSFKKGSVVLPWTPLDTVSKATATHSSSDTFFIANDGPGTSYREPGKDELTRYQKSYPRSKAV
ncbi:hypothetical protein SAMN05216588_13211 [Pseudomonas flavescens]|uniref:Uncharacterized protein n=1 Tax=Phytopseudomonas flavescens TaxID=29435 RepID=A0A1G8Q0A6_9GAMM|nr:hypothetical protein [Pseudomonas flavescens]SDI98184.1 hypothetical protein SAMN05216588_13211 [Pseudomonas flavescens]